ncbi:UDP-2,3-diacetamido-2,3-dideoxy-D-glucuronate 2-epimerase [compost metagenome]
MRDQTEWIELVECGANVLVGADGDAIVAAAHCNVNRAIVDDNNLYGGGQAAKRIATHLARL